MLASDPDEASASLTAPIGAHGRPWALYTRLVAAAAFFATMVAYLFPFFEPRPPYHLGPIVGFRLFLYGFAAIFTAPTGFLYCVAFSLPLIAAFFGLMYQRRNTYRASVVSAVFAVLGFGGLVTGYLIDSADRWAFGYFTAGGAILVAGVAVAIRLVGGRRLGEFEPPIRWEEIEPALSAGQEALRRARNS